MRLRDLLKFEFFFAEKDALARRAAPGAGAPRRRTGRSALGEGPEAIQALLPRASARSTRTASCGPSSRPTAWSATRSSAASPATAFDEAAFLAQLPRARQAVRAAAPHPQRRVGLAGAVRQRRSAWRGTASSLAPGRRASSPSGAAPSPARSASACAASTRSTRWPRPARRTDRLGNPRLESRAELPSAADRPPTRRREGNA